jgi:hypothetical protein
MNDHTRVSVSSTRRAFMNVGAKIATFVALLTAGSGADASYHGSPPGGPGAPGRRGKKKKKTVRRFARPMTGAKEVPAGTGDPDGLGRGIFEFKNNDRTICARITVQSLTAGSTVSGLHIHEGGPTVDGPIKVDFQGKLSKCVSVPRALGNRIKSNPARFYANLHTNNFPDGAIRAQLQK